MTKREDNALLTQTGPGTPGGNMMRRYWHPIALGDELPADGAPLPMRLFSEDLVLFRDDTGRLGLLGLFCSHRCADLSYGRVEDGGLRCLYHGWLYDVHGRCLDMPAEPAESRYKDEIRHPAYRCIERAGLIFAYMGADEPPLFPEYEFLAADAAHRHLQKTILDCNWLQSLEGNIDPAHLSYLHRPFGRKDPRDVPGSDKSADVYYREDTRPTLQTERTRFGLRIFSIREAGADQRYVRVTNFVMPNKATIVGNEGRVGHGYAVHWHVPIDDTHHMRIDFVYNRLQPIDHAKYEERAKGELAGGHRLKRNLGNRYLQDRAKMQSDNFSGMGDYFPVHDAFATESAGPIHDRSREHLASTDVCIVAARSQLMAAIRDVAAGKDPIHVARKPADNNQSDIVVVSEVIPNGSDHRDIWRRHAGVSPAAE